MPPDKDGDRYTNRYPGARLGRELARLTPRQRAVLVLRFFEDLSEVETADTLGCSIGTVKNR